MRTIATASFVGANLIIASCVVLADNPQQQKLAQAPKRVSPTAPVAIECFRVAIIGATEDETRILKNSLGFIAARTPQVFANGYCRQVVMCEGSRRFAAYQPIEKTISIPHGSTGVDIMFHEIDHACGVMRSESKEGQALLTSWEKTTGAVYSVACHEQLKQAVFPVVPFLSLYSTYDALEHRAEWKRFVYLLLYEKYQVSIGELMPFDTAYNYNPLKRLKPNATWRAMLKWSLDAGDITLDDYRSVEADFAGGE